MDDLRWVRNGGRSRRRGHPGLQRGRRDIRGRAADRFAESDRPGRHRKSGVSGVLRGGNDADRMSGRLPVAGVWASVCRPARTPRRVPVRPAAASEGYQ